MRFMISFIPLLLVFGVYIVGNIVLDGQGKGADAGSRFILGLYLFGGLALWFFGVTKF